MARLRWTGRGMFHDPSRGFRTTDGEHEFDDPDRVDEYLSHRSGDWELVEDEDEDAGDDIDGPEADTGAEAGVDKASDESENETEGEGEDEMVNRAEPPFDPAEYTIAEIADEITEISDNAKLAALYSAEVEGKDRVGAKDAIDDRLDELES